MAVCKCEYLTNKYYNDFKYAYKQNNMLYDMEFFKVLFCDGENARVYYVSENYDMGNVLAFIKENGIWKFTKWEDTVWTNLGGNADDTVWPYWWHCIYKK